MTFVRAGNKNLPIVILVIFSVGLVAAGFTITFLGHHVSKSVIEHLLRDDAQESAAVWSNFLRSRPAELQKLVSGKGASDVIQKASEDLRHFTYIVRYELYSPTGVLVYSWGKIGARTVAPGQASFLTKEQTGASAPGEAKVRLFSSSDKYMPSNYAAVLRPVFFNGKPVAKVLTYVDQSHRHAKYTHALKLIALVTSLLLVASLAIPLVIIAHNMYVRWKAEKHIRYLAHHDQLSGLLNRTAFYDQFSNAIRHCQERGQKAAVLCLDLDGFKQINDNFGHAAGDAVVKTVSARIKQLQSQHDLAARLGGDEFAIALTGIKSRQDVEQFVERLQIAITKPIIADGQTISCQTSIGIAVAPEDGEDRTVLLKNADLALYRAKADGRNTHRYFEPQLDYKARRRRTLERDLRDAISNDEFEILYQPQFCLATGEITGSEALLRWSHPQLGQLKPNEFIPIAEDTGLINPLGMWVLKKACEAATGWTQPLKIAVNLSPVQFHPGGLTESIKQILDETGLDPARLELEITEGSLLAETEKVLGELRQLRNLNIAIILDDFGSGYSSLGYLARFPFDKIKIDACFVSELDKDPSVTTIVRSIIALSKSLNMTILAEGVETSKQADWLKTLGCDQVQGFLYSRPIDSAGQAALMDQTQNIDQQKTHVA